MYRTSQTAIFGHVTERYDVIIVGSGAGGGTLAHTLAPSGKRILLLERGNFLPREIENWDPGPVFVDGRYISPDPWYDADGKEFQPQVHYYVGGATKLYGAALYRLRPADFGEIQHADGLSPAWPLSYDDFEPWYTKAEWLYQVHGIRGEDPTEGHHSKEYPWPPVSHERRVQEISDALAAGGYHPFHAPCGILLNEANRPLSECIRCATCDGYPCLVHAKADADVIAVRPLLDQPNVTLLVNAEVQRLETDPSGRTVSRVQVNREGSQEFYEAEPGGGRPACGRESRAYRHGQRDSRRRPSAEPDGVTGPSHNYEMRPNAGRSYPDCKRPGTDEHVPAYCRLRIPVELRAELPGRTGRVGRMAVPAAP